MAWQRDLASALVPLLLAAACSLVIDRDRTFADDASEEGVNPGAGGTGGGPENDSGVECAPDSRECTSTLLRVCINGHWREQVCPESLPACVDGQCRVCVPGTFQCSSVTQLEKCSELGEWAPHAQCRPMEQWCVEDACVHNEPPQLYITLPKNDAVFTVRSPDRLAELVLEGGAYDENPAEDLSPSIEWHAARVIEPDGEKLLGSGGRVSAQLENIRGCEQPGTAYDISATVVDRAGAVERQSIRVWVRNDPLCPSD
jgi:hypothetical protein